ncbi:MAG: 4'-phosphopantetheinyl transferase superfamily protein [Chloroflexi bacterium]|nr:4'-phosphopantetheinyl transferase superfamily protein [Chloroflexota bacterium]
MTLFPVVLPVTQGLPTLQGREKVALLSGCARQALRQSADRAGVALQSVSKNADDVPLPSAGCYWSVAHKPKYAAAVVSSSPAGIDIEEVRPRRQSIFRYVASEEEWDLGGGRSWDTLYRYWTAKEAVVKAAGTGLAGMRSCRVISVPDETAILLFYQDNLRTVEQLRFDGHIVAVVKDDNHVEWTFSDPAVPAALDTPGRRPQEPLVPTW